MLGYVFQTAVGHTLKTKGSPGGQEPAPHAQAGTSAIEVPRYCPGRGGAQFIVDKVSFQNAMSPSTTVHRRRELKALIGRGIRDTK
jgi:hypothetical protein